MTTSRPPWAPCTARARAATRAPAPLVNNLYNGTFATPEHDRYTWDDSANIQALEQLKSMPGITFDALSRAATKSKVFYQAF